MTLPACILKALISFRRKYLAVDSEEGQGPTESSFCVSFVFTYLLRWRNRRQYFGIDRADVPETSVEAHSAFRRDLYHSLTVQGQ